MTLDEYIEHLETRCAQIVAEEAARLASEIRQRTPANRTQTRQAVRVVLNGSRARVGLRFARRYSSSTETPTHKRLRTQWSALRPLVRQRLREKLNSINEE